MLIRECLHLNADQTIESSVENEITNETVDESVDFFISFANRRRNARRISIEQDIEDEVKKYLSDSRENYEILNEYPQPHVKEVFFRYNTTLAASAAVERIFIQAELISRPQRRPH